MKRIRLFKIVGFLVGALFYLAPSLGNAQNTVLITPTTPLPAGAGTNLPISFTSGVTSPGSDGTLTVYYQGDFDGTGGNLENADIFDENSNLLGFTPPATQQCFANFDSVSFIIPVATLASWAADQIISFDFTPTAAVNPTLCGANDVIFKLEYTPLTGPDDAGLSSVDSPYVFCAGANNAIVTIRNSGTNQLDSVRVNWELNGVTQPTIFYTSLLDTLGGASPSFASIALGSANFNAGTNVLKAWTSFPNGIADTNNLNDTVTVNLVSAAAPTSISLSNVTLNTVDVNAVGGAGTIDYEYGPIGFTIGTGTTGSSPTSNFTVTGLSQGTTYDIYVRSNCGSGDVSAYVGPQTFNTSYGVPFFEDFTSFTPPFITQNPWPNGWSSTTTTDPNWESEIGNGVNPNSFGTGALWDNTQYGTNGGTYVYMETSGGAVGDSADFVSPPIFIDPTLSTVELSYYYFMFGSVIDGMEVIIDTNGVEQVLATYTGQQQANQTDPWLLGTHLLTGYQGKSVVIKFRGFNPACCSGDIAIDDIRIDPVLPLNAGVIEVQNPVGNLCAGPTNVVVGVKNFGSNIIDSVNVVWDINGVLDSVMHVATILPGDTESVSLATVNISSTVVYNLQFYTNRPNGAADQFAGDDTLSINGLRTGLDGVYTLDATSPASATNFTSFGQLEQVLNLYGVCGPVTVNVAPGTYNETLALDNIAGLSATDRLTIDGGDSATTVIENNLANDNAIIALSGVSYTTIKNLTVRSTRTNTSLHFGVHLGGGSDFDSLVNVRVTVNPNATFNVFGVGATSNPTTNFGNGNHANNFVMMNSSVDGGDWNVVFRGNGGPFPAGTGSGWVMNNHFINNTLTGADDYGLYTDDQDGLQVIGNTVSGLRTSSTFTGYGIAAFDAMNFKISANYVTVPYTGIYVTNANSAATGTRIGFSEVSNNMVSCNVNSGIWLQRPVKVNIWYNSVYCGSTQNFDAALYLDDGFGSPAIDSLDVRNNALYGAGKAFKIDEPDSVFTKFDNNSFYTLGTDLLDIDAAIYADLVTYQTAQPAYNAASLDGDPQFVSITDLRVVGAFLDGGGDISVPITVDIEGETRPLPGSTTVDIGADEFDPPLCPPSVNLGVTNITLTTADIFWTGVAMDYEYEVVPTGVAQGTSGAANIIRTGLDSLTITGLTPSTQYDFYTREICGRGDTSIWIGPFTFGTANGIPFFQDFEAFTVGNSVTEEGWVNRNGTAGPNWQVNTRTGSFATGPEADNTTGIAGGKFVYLETSTGAGIDTLVSPPIFVDPSQTAVVLEYFIHMHGAAMGTFEVYVDTNGVLNQLNTLTGQQTTNQLDPWTPYTHTLAGYQGNSIVLKFVGIRGTSFTSDMAVDDVRLFEPSPQDVGVTDIISPTSGCGLGNDSVTVEISNLGTATVDTIPVVYVVNGGTPVVETYFDSIPVGQTANFTFSTTVNLSTIGSYDIVSYTNLAIDGDVTNDTSDVTINSVPLVGGLPYTEDFETSNGGWTSSGAASSWAWGTPAGTVITSAAGGTGAWVTNLTGNYNNSEASYIESPCLDFSALTVDPILTFSLTYDTESCCDEGWVEYSTDAGATWTKLLDNGGALQWYNDAFNQWWDGTSSGGAGVWVNAENILTGLAGQPSVKIRFAFASDGSVIREGFGIDDVSIDLPQPYDIELSNIITPVSGAYTVGTSDSIRISIANLGSDTATNFTANYSLNGGAVVTETIASLLPGATMVHTFNSSVVLPGPGQADTLDVYVDFALDTDNSNDSIFGYIYDNDIKGLPYLEDFENSYALGNVFTLQQGGWTSTRPNSPDWEIEDASGANENSLNTGPFYDRTSFPASGGHYVYLETSGGALGDQDTLRSPSIIIPANSPALSLDYSYHMFGAAMGTLEVFIEANGVYTRVDSVGGQIQLAGDSAWTDTSIALTGAFNGQIVNIVFVGSRGTSFTSDMSIDDISLDFLVGVDQVASELEGISVSPNPSNGLFTLNIETPSQENFNMTVRDAQGRSVYTANFDVNGKYRNELDFTSFAKGVYYMQIQTETEFKVEKLIIQ